MTGEAPNTEVASRREVEFSISIRTILLVGVTVAVGWALASVGDVLLLILVSIFGVAVLSPVVNGMERRLPWSRALCSAVLVLGIAVLLGAVLVILLQSIVDAVRGFSHDLPGLIEKARQSDLGGYIDDGSSSLDFLKQHVGDITSGLGKASGGAARVGVSAFGVVAVSFSVTFLILFGLIDEPRVRASIGRLLYRDKRVRYEKVADRIILTTSRYMLGNVAISVICATIYGVTAVILGLPYPLALALIAGILDLIPTVGALLAGIIIGIVALSVSLRRPDRLRDRDRRLSADRELRPAADDHREGRPGLRLHRARERPALRFVVRGRRGDHRSADRRGGRDHPRRGDGRETSPGRRRGHGSAATCLTHPLPRNPSGAVRSLVDSNPTPTAR